MPATENSALQSQFLIWKKANKAWSDSIQNPDEDIRDQCLDMVTNLLARFADIRAISFEDVLTKLLVWRDARLASAQDYSAFSQEDLVIASAIEDLNHIICRAQGGGEIVNLKLLSSMR